MIFNQSKYTTWYNNIITRAQSRVLPKEIYSEKHHVIPRSLGGSDEKINLAELTAKEHFICHILLTKMVTGTDRSKMIRAVIIMKSHNGKQPRYLNSRLYETCKVEYAKQRSKSQIGSGNTFYKKKHTETARANMSKNKKGKNYSWNTGLTKETSVKLKSVCDNISKAKEGVRWWTNGILETQAKSCPGDHWIIGRISNPSFKWDQSNKDARSAKYQGGKMNWWNNGLKNQRSIESPGAEWKRGRLMSPSLYAKFCKNIK